MPERPKTLADQWRDYEKRVVPHAAGRKQRQECRRAFYAGTAALYNLIMAFPDPGPDATPQDFDHIQRLADEMTAFQKAVARGEA